MVKRKTIDIESLIIGANDICKNSKADAGDIRQGAMNLLEFALHRTGNYKGFRYLLKDEVKDGVPGVNYDARGLPDADYTKRFENTDRTRVCYF